MKTSLLVAAALGVAALVTVPSLAAEAGRTSTVKDWLHDFDPDKHCQRRRNRHKNVAVRDIPEAIWLDLRTVGRCIGHRLGTG